MLHMSIKGNDIYICSYCDEIYIHILVIRYISILWCWIIYIHYVMIYPYYGIRYIFILWWWDKCPYCGDMYCFHFSAMHCPHCGDMYYTPCISVYEYCPHYCHICIFHIAVISILRWCIAPVLSWYVAKLIQCDYNGSYLRRCSVRWSILSTYCGDVPMLQWWCVVAMVNETVMVR